MVESRPPIDEQGDFSAYFAFIIICSYQIIQADEAEKKEARRAWTRLLETAKDAAMSDKRQIVSAAAKAVTIPFLDLGNLMSALNGLRSSEGFKERGGQKKVTPPRSRSGSVSGSAAGSRPSSRQSTRSRSHSKSMAGSPERTPSPSPERGAAGGMKRAIVDMLDIGEQEPTGHLTVKLSANKVG